LDTEEAFPSSNEKAGYWLGMTHNVGDVFTYKILRDDKATVISRSVIPPANDCKRRNLQINFDPNMDPDIRLDTASQNMQPEDLVFAAQPVLIKTGHNRFYNQRKAGPAKKTSNPKNTNSQDLGGD
jgi:hypothetical protein